MYPQKLVTWTGHQLLAMTLKSVWSAYSIASRRNCSTYSLWVNSALITSKKSKARRTVIQMLCCWPLTCFDLTAERCAVSGPAAGLNASVVCKELRDHSDFLDMFLDKGLWPHHHFTPRMVSNSDIGVKRLVTEQSLLKNKYSDITTLATFFSSISATALQYTDASNMKITSGAVNTLWVASLVSSIAAAGNGLLAMSWHTSFRWAGSYCLLTVPPSSLIE